MLSMGLMGRGLVLGVGVHMWASGVRAAQRFEVGGCARKQGLGVAAGVP